MCGGELSINPSFRIGLCITGIPSKPYASTPLNQCLVCTTPQHLTSIKPTGSGPLSPRFIIGPIPRTCALDLTLFILRPLNTHFCPVRALLRGFGFETDCHFPALSPSRIGLPRYGPLWSRNTATLAITGGALVLGVKQARGSSHTEPEPAYTPLLIHLYVCLNPGRCFPQLTHAVS